MKLLIASDIHGAAGWCTRLMKVIEAESPDRVVLLGDLLYHGPRNDLPRDYAPKRVIEMLNSMARQVIAVRGNCDAEVDQMVLDFPCMADYNVLWDPTAANPPIDGGIGRELFLTHGHVWGPGIHNSVDSWPTLSAGAALVYGHTHKWVLETYADGNAHAGVTVFNPGSVGIPKDGIHSYGTYEDGRFEHHPLGE